jgi:general secretion pathway protein D
MKTWLSTTLALLCAVSAWAQQQAPDANRAIPVFTIRNDDLRRQSPATNAVVVSAPPTAGTPAAAPAPAPPLTPFPAAQSPTVLVPKPNPGSTPSPVTNPADPRIGIRQTPAGPSRLQPPSPTPAVPGQPPAPSPTPTPAAESPAPTPMVAIPGGAPAPSPDDAPAPNPNARQTFRQDPVATDEPIEFDWMNADLSMVLTKYSELTGRSAIMQQGLQGMVTFHSSGPLKVDEAIGALESVLLINGFAVVPMGEKFFKLVPSPYGPQEGLPVLKEDATAEQFDRLVAQVVRVKFLDPTDVARALGGSGGTGGGMPPMPGATPQGGGPSGSNRVFMHPYGQIIPLPRSSALLLIDTALNVSRLKQIIEYMDTTSETKMETRVYVLENADSATVYSILQQLIAADQGTSTPGQTGQIAPTAMAAGVGLGRSRPSVTSIEESVIMGRVLINYDMRTNAIILITQETNFTFFEKIIKALDVKTNQDFKTRVFFLNYADANDMALILYQLVLGAEPNAVGGRAGSTSGAPFTSRTSTAGGRTTGLGGSTSGARSGALGSRGSATGSRTGSSARSSSSRRSTGSRTAGTAARTTTPATPTTPGMPTGAAGANMAQQLIEIIPDVRNNALVVFAPEQDLESLTDVIKQLDVFPPQVAIDVVVAEVSVDDNTTFGVDLFQKALTSPSRAGAGISTPDGGGIPSTVSGTNVLSRLLDPRAITSPQALTGAGLTGGLSYFASFFGDDLRAVITALQQDSKFKVLQTPHLYTSNNQAARVFVGESRPVVTSTLTDISGGTTAGRSNYENVDIGVGLEVTPLINPDGVVTFNIYQTVDDVKSTVLIDNNEVPILSRREAEAVAVTCKDGQIIILGGLTSNTRRQTVNQVPILGDIPLLGYLFKKTSWNNVKTELVFFLRPKVIRTIEEAQRYTWGRLEKSKDLRTMPIRNVEGYSPMQDKRHSEKLKAIDRFDKTEKF